MRAQIRARLQAESTRVVQRLGPNPLSPRRGGQVLGVVESLREWAAETPGADYHMLRPATSFVRRPARTLTPQRQERLDLLAQHQAPEAFRAVVPGARLVNPYAPLVITSDRRVVVESAFDHLRSSHRFPRRLHRSEHLPGRFMALVNQWSNNHFHWLLDTLPRASLLPLDDEPHTPVIVPAQLSGNQLESLALIGISQDRMVPFDQPHLQVDELVFPSFVGQPGYPPRWAVSWLRDRLVPPPPQAKHRLWISRAGATRGRVANEEAVLTLLRRYGFESFEPEKHPLTEQLRLISGAEMIVAPHGAGLANLFAARDATVIEIQSERWWGNGCYYTLSDAADLDYWYVLSKMTPSRHLAVDVGVLQATVEAALDARSPSRRT